MNEKPVILKLLIAYQLLIEFLRIIIHAYRILNTEVGKLVK